MGGVLVGFFGADVSELKIKISTATTPSGMQRSSNQVFDKQ